MIIKIPNLKLCEKTLCGECKHLDWSQPTKDSPTYFWCKEKSTYRNPNADTSCSSWTK